MGYQLTSRVYTLNKPTGAARWVLLILADMANQQCDCWSSIATITQRAGISRRMSNLGW